MILQVNIVAKKYDGTDPIAGTMLISVQRHPVGRMYPHKVAWARRQFDLRTWPRSDKELLTLAAVRLAGVLTSGDDGLIQYDDAGKRVAENMMG